MRGVPLLLHHVRILLRRVSVWLHASRKRPLPPLPELRHRQWQTRKHGYEGETYQIAQRTALWVAFENAANDSESRVDGVESMSWIIDRC